MHECLEITDLLLVLNLISSLTLENDLVRILAHPCIIRYLFLLIRDYVSDYVGLHA